MYIEHIDEWVCYYRKRRGEDMNMHNPAVNQSASSPEPLGKYMDPHEPPFMTNRYITYGCVPLTSAGPFASFQSPPSPPPPPPPPRPQPSTQRQSKPHSKQTTSSSSSTHSTCDYYPYGESYQQQLLNDAMISNKRRFVDMEQSDHHHNKPDTTTTTNTCPPTHTTKKQKLNPTTSTTTTTTPTVPPTHYLNIDIVKKKTYALEIRVYKHIANNTIDISFTSVSQAYADCNPKRVRGMSTDEVKKSKPGRVIFNLDPEKVFDALLVTLYQFTVKCNMDSVTDILVINHQGLVDYMLELGSDFIKDNFFPKLQTVSYCASITSTERETYEHPVYTAKLQRKAMAFLLGTLRHSPVNVLKDATIPLKLIVGYAIGAAIPI